MSESNQTTHSIRSGVAVAAFLSAGIGLLILAIVQVATELSETFKTRVFDLGKRWIPGAEGIGPYSGKETLFLVAWLFSWSLLHLLLRTRDVNVKRWFGVFLLLVFVAAILLWPPVWHILKGE